MANLDEYTYEQMQEFLKAVGRDPESLRAAEEVEEAARQSRLLEKMGEASKKPLGTLGEKFGSVLKKTPTAQAVEAVEKQAAIEAAKAAGASELSPALNKVFVEDIVKQASKPSTASTAEQAMQVLAPDQLPVPSGKVFDPSEIKRKVIEEAAKRGSTEKLSGVINLPGPDEVKDLVPTSGGPIQPIGQTAKNIGEDVIEAQYRNIPSFTDKARGFATKVSPVLKSGLSGAATSMLTGALYDVDQEAKQEEIRSGKRDIPIPGKPGYVFRGSDIVKAGSESPVAADVLPSMGDIFKRALAPAGSEAQMEAYKNIRKTGYGQLIHGGEEIPTDSSESPSTLEKAKGFLGALNLFSDEESALEKSASEGDKEEAARLIKQIATNSSIPLKKELSEDDKQFDAIINKAKSIATKEEQDEEDIVKPKPFKTRIEKPSDLPKEEKTSLEKMLAEASKKDLEERTKYSDLLKEAVAKRDFTQLIAQLGSAASTIGAGIGGTVERGTVAKPVGEDIYKRMIETAAQPISDLEKRRVLEIEEQKMDPESSDSKAARAIMEEFGIKVPKTATAAFLEKQFPSIATLTARREQAQKEKALAEERRQERLEARLGREAIAEERMAERRKERLEKDVTRFGTSKQIEEQRSAMDEIEAVEDKIRTFTNDPSFSFDTFRKKQYKGDIPGASVPGIGRTSFYSSDARELDTKFQAVLNQAIRSFAGKAVTKNELDRIRTQYEAGKFANEADYLQAMSDVKKAIKKGIQTTEKAFGKDVLKEYESRGGRVYSVETSKEESKSSQKVSSAQLKALVSSKEKNPHGASEAAVARHLISQGFSVEGY